jgi:hypothetical protein
MTKTSTGSKASTGSRASAGSRAPAGSRASTGSENKASGKKLAEGGSTAPRPIQFAAKLTLAGAAGTVVYGLYWLIVAVANRAATLRHFESMDHETAGQASSGFAASLVFTLLICIAAAALWVWMGRANRSGHGWARIAASVLFVLWSWETYQSISIANTAAGLVSLIIMLIVWGIGGAAIYKLWLPESSAYFKSFSR